MSFDKWAESMKDGSTPKEDRIRLWQTKAIRKPTRPARRKSHDYPQEIKKPPHPD